MNAAAPLARARALHEAGRLEDADALYQQALAAGGGALARAHLAELRLQQGRIDEAVALAQRAIELDPACAQAHASLGTAYNLLERPEDAIAAYDGALAADADFAEAYYGQGLALQKLQRHDEAAACLERALVIDPDYAEASCALGAALADIKRHRRAATAFKQALAIDPEYVEAICGLAGVLHAEQREAEAIALYRQADELRPRDAPILTALALALQADGALIEAIERFKQAAALTSGAPGAHLLLGNALEEIGRIEEAIGAFEHALMLDPRHLHAAFSLVNARRVRADDPALATLQALDAAVEALAEDERVMLRFGLGKALADLGRPQEGFAQLRAGNALKRRGLMYDERASLATLERVRTVFTREFLARHSGNGAPSPRPVLIVGLPRSGSTLVEHILASHHAVFGGGERSDFSDAMREAGLDAGRPEFLDQCARVDAGQLARIGAAYLRRLAAGAARAGLDNAQRITDKMLANYCFAGMVHLALPQARIIHTRRDPVDCCLSCYSRLFASDIPYAYDLGEFGRHFRAYEALMDHWRDVLPPGVLLDVTYEELVDDFEANARRIVAHCGLEWDPACLRFYETQRPVRTASVVQVRQPIYRSSVGKWRPGDEDLRPLLDELARG